MSASKKEDLKQAWLAYSSATVASRAPDDEPEEVAEDAIVIANLMTRAFEERFGGTGLPDLTDNELPEEQEEEEEEVEEEEEDRPRKRSRR